MFRSQGWGISLRGSQTRNKKDILLCLQDLEILEKNKTLNEEELALGASLQKELLQIYEADEIFGLVNQLKIGFYKEIIILSSSIE
jgi:hypothetical protein